MPPVLLHREHVRWRQTGDVGETRHRVVQRLAEEQEIADAVIRQSRRQAVHLAQGRPAAGQHRRAAGTSDVQRLDAEPITGRHEHPA